MDEPIKDYARCSGREGGASIGSCSDLLRNNNRMQALLYPTYMFDPLWAICFSDLEYLSMVSLFNLLIHGPKPVY
jgi:hypothetical protein